MTFQELLSGIRNLKSEEERSCTDHSLEVVVSLEKIRQYQELLDAFFGPPFKSEGQMPSIKASLCSQHYGGIRRNQTMYYLKDKDSAALAFLWPWGNGSRITIKIFHEKPKSSFLGKIFGN